MAKMSLEEAFKALASDPMPSCQPGSTTSRPKVKKSELTHPALTPSDTLAILARALKKQTKETLADCLVQLAANDCKLFRELESQFPLEYPSHDLVAATRQAIDDATDFDERQINYNFDYDSDAYTTIGKNFAEMIEANRWSDVLPLALELMNKASYQVEMSDEGMMIDDIDECLECVIDSLYEADLPVAERLEWCQKMIQTDRTGCISEKRLADLELALTNLNS
ncbi:MAG: hypothetical protein ABL921_19595 [Pirellula sp.]